MLHRVLRHRRNHSYLTPRLHRRAFTLAELLIVVAIIGVLISILLPTLGAARRSANSVKCLSALKDLGAAFQMYAQDNSRAYPVAYWAPGVNVIPGTASVRPWQDFLVKYVHKKESAVKSVGGTDAADLSSYQQSGSSVLFGCPQFTFEANYDPNALPSGGAANMFNSGYGMNIYGMAPYQITGGPPEWQATQKQPGTTNLTNNPGNFALINSTATGAGGLPAYYGQFIKMEQWSRRGATKALLADSNTFAMIHYRGTTTGNAPSKSTITFQPLSQANPATVTNRVDVDGFRHLAPTNDRKKGINAKGVNMLFADGHAASVTPIEAWIAIFGAGSDYMQ